MHREQAAASGRTRPRPLGATCAAAPFVRTFRSVGFPPFILACWRDSSHGGRAASNATTASVVNAACPLSFRDRLREFQNSCDGIHSTALFLRTAVCLHLVSSLLHFQLLSSVEGVEEAVVVQESKSGAGAAPPLPPYPNIGELNLDGKTQSGQQKFHTGNSSWAR